jgi:hypothetical protein
MSSTCSLASAGSASALSAPVCEPSDSVRSTLSADPYSRSIGRMSRASPTFAPLTQIDWVSSGGSTSSVEASPASRTVSLELRKGRQTPATSGRKCFELCHSCDPLGFLVKTLLASSVWRSTLCSLTWKALATPHGRLLFQLQVSEHHTEDTDFGSSLLPTPAARDYRYPNARSYKDRGGGKKGEQLPNVIGGPLNPEFVEWLLGYETGWTDCEPSATPSSRRSRKSSGERSCPPSPLEAKADSGQARADKEQE